MHRCAFALLITGLLLGPGIAQDGPKTDRAKMQGTWKVISVSSGPAGSLKKVPDEKIKDVIVVITNDKLLMRSPKESEDKAVYKIDKLDPTKKPKWIDLSLIAADKDKTTLGIYELDGDNLKLYIGDPSPNPKRPTDFDDSKAGIILMVLKRDKN